MFFLFLTQTEMHCGCPLEKSVCVCSAYYVVVAQRGGTGTLSVSLFICLSMRGTDGPFSSHPGTRYWLSWCYKKDIITYETLKETRHGGSAICYPVNVSINQPRSEFLPCISKLTWQPHYILSQRGNKTSVNSCFLAMTSSKVMFTFLLCNSFEIHTQGDFFFRIHTDNQHYLNQLQLLIFL